ncbi:gamma-glutamylcyclotransferase [bacterium]|nr:gamma-glutamylcyclotransferase [bacterium]
MRDQEMPRKHTIPNDTATPPITCFVYGTLKRGYWNHDRFCRNAIDIRPATTWGRLYLLPAGYPALEVPESAILAHGTADPLADAATQARLAATLPQHAANRPPSGDWDLIHGELITFPDPARDLPPIDRLEGFRLGQDSLYQRVLVFARTPEMVVPAWLYVSGRCLIGSGERLRNGVWG